MRYAVINETTNEVLNVIEWDGVSQWSPPQGTVLKEDYEVGIGDLWHEGIQDFLRPLKSLRPPIDESMKAERQKAYEDAKDKLKSSVLFVNPITNELEA